MSFILHKKKLFSILCSMIVLFLFFYLNIANVNAETVEEIKATNYVTDYADLISQEAEETLNQKLYNYFSSTSHQIIVVTVNDMSGDYIERYAVKLFEKLKPGSEKNDNGILLLIAKSERKARIEVGYGLEPYVTDGVANYVMQNILIKNFKENNFEKGILEAVDELMKYGPDGLIVETVNEKYSLLFFIAVTSFIFLTWLSAILGRTKSWWLGGVIGFCLSLIIVIITGFVLFKLIYVFIATIFGLLFDYIVSKNYQDHKNGLKDGPPDWWAGSTWGPGSSGISWSGGGFSGGGGSSGGGGASGSW